MCSGAEGKDGFLITKHGWRVALIPSLHHIGTESACGYFSYFERMQRSKMKGKNPTRVQNFRGQKFKKGFIFNVKR
jgi:hypothetical protein